MECESYKQSDYPIFETIEELRESERREKNGKNKN